MSGRARLGLNRKSSEPHFVYPSFDLPSHPRTMALTFSADLDNIFGIGDGIDGLQKTVEEKFARQLTLRQDKIGSNDFRKQNVSSQTAELQALEARLQATEARLKEKMSRSSSAVVGNNFKYNLSRKATLGHASQGSRPTSRSGGIEETRPSSRLGTNHSSKGENASSFEGRNIVARQDSFYQMRSMLGALPQTPSVNLRNAYG